MAFGCCGGCFSSSSGDGNFVGLSNNWFAALDTTLLLRGFWVGSKSETADPNSWRVQLFVVFIPYIRHIAFRSRDGFLHQCEQILPSRNLSESVNPRVSCRIAHNAQPNLFTGFDRNDNIELADLSLPERPLHVLNGALNIVRGEQLAWQERKAESFTMSRLHCGSYKIGYRPSAEYGRGNTTRGITLGHCDGYFRRGSESEYGLSFFASSWPFDDAF